MTLVLQRVDPGEDSVVLDDTAGVPETPVSVHFVSIMSYIVCSCCDEASGT